MAMRKKGYFNDSDIERKNIGRFVDIDSGGCRLDYLD